MTLDTEIAVVIRMSEGKGNDMQKITKFSSPILLLIVIGIFVSCNSKSSEIIYIDFEDTVAIDKIINNQEDEELPLRIAVYPVLSQKVTIEAYRLIAQKISLELNREVALIVRKSYAEINVLLANGGVDIAFLASGAYASYTGHEDIELLAMQERFGVPYYYSYIIVPRDSQAENLENLKGHTFAFTDPLSFSGKIALIYMLEQIGEKPETFFSNYIYTYGHQNSLEAVANKVVEGASIGSLVYDNAKLNNKELADKVKIIGISQKNGTGPVVARKALGKEEIKTLKRVFLHLHEDSEMKEALEILLIDKYIEPQMELYNHSKTILYELDDGL